MGVYIPNVEMPRGCNSCPLVMEIDNTCSLTMGGCTKDERPPHCPLIEIGEEAIDIAQDIIDGCKELKERINADIVRCGECRWCDDKGKGRALICTNPYIDMDIHPLDFCSYGERRADE